MTKYFSEEERREANRKKLRRRRERRAALEGRLCRVNAPRNTGLSKDRKVIEKRYARMKKAMEEGRTFKLRKLCDEHVKVYLKYKKHIELCGPPKPSKKSMGSAAYAKWIYWNSPGARDKAKSKSSRYKERLADAYIACQLNMKLKDVPNELLEMKRELIMCNRITKQLSSILKEKTNANQ